MFTSLPVTQSPRADLGELGGPTGGEEAGGDRETSRATLGSRSIPRLLWFLQCVIEVEHTLQALCLEDGHWVTSLSLLLAASLYKAQEVPALETCNSRAQRRKEKQLETV